MIMVGYAIFTNLVSPGSYYEVNFTIFAKAVLVFKNVFSCGIKVFIYDPFLKIMELMLHPL